MLYILDANTLIDTNRDYYPIGRIPDVCAQFKIEAIDTFEFVRRLDFRTNCGGLRDHTSSHGATWYSALGDCKHHACAVGTF